VQDMMADRAALLLSHKPSVFCDSLMRLYVGVAKAPL
jgi:hypothetical protein